MESSNLFSVSKMMGSPFKVFLGSVVIESHWGGNQDHNKLVDMLDLVSHEFFY